MNIKFTLFFLLAIIGFSMASNFRGLQKEGLIDGVCNEAFCTQPDISCPNDYTNPEEVKCWACYIVNGEQNYEFKC